MKLFAEQPVLCKTLTEAVDQTDGQHKEPQYFLEGTFLQANIENRNGRIYPLEIMKKEVERYDRDYIQTHRAFGELCHPTNMENPGINLDRVSHIITKVWQDGDYFKARAKILDTPCGEIVKAMIRAGCQLGVSSRALGSVTVKDGVNYVNDDFHLITLGDIVYEPSAQTAFPVGMINEDVEWELDPASGEYVKVDKSVSRDDHPADQPEKEPAERPTDKDHNHCIGAHADDIDDRLDRLTHRFDDLDSRLNDIGDRLAKVDQQINDTNELASTIVSHIKTNRQLDEFENILKNIQ